MRNSVRSDRSGAGRSGDDFRRETFDAIVVGSGAGGAVTATILAEAGMSVLVLEEGPEIKEPEPGGRLSDALVTSYRNGGITPIIGNPPVAFVEGMCVGGSTEVNSGFWYRPAADIIDGWVEAFHISDLSYASLCARLDELESEVKPVTTSRDLEPWSSRLLNLGAERTNLVAIEVPRIQSGEPHLSVYDGGGRNSMSRTFLPRAIEAGARIEPGRRVTRVLTSRRSVTGVEVEDPDGGRAEINARRVIVCAGPTQTPGILRASGIKKNVGNTLGFHPMLKVAAEFDFDLDSHKGTLPVYQITLEDDAVFIGGAVFSRGYLAVTLADSGVDVPETMKRWRRFATYYAAIRIDSEGTVRQIPFTGDTVLRHSITDDDIQKLLYGARRLCELLFEAGARYVYPAILSGIPVESIKHIDHVMESATRRNINLTTVHAFATCPMGENRQVCAVDSYGQVHGYENLIVADASILPGSPGGNPQATIMALALRNAQHVIDTI